MAARTEIKVKDFVPSRNGFKFPNAFPGVPLPDAIAKLIDASKSVYGLCGGMCFSVIDFARSGLRPPEVDRVPGRESPLYDYIARRQLASWGVLSTQVLRYVKWMSYPDDKAQEKTLRSWYELRKGLNKGDLTVLGLIYRDLRETLRVWDNHQVLAYGYTKQPDGAIHIHLYDPNYPKNDDIFIKATSTTVTHENGVKKPGLLVEQFWGQNKIRDMHGFFVVPYQYEAPPRNPQG
jgi:hypothetical protein